MPDQFRLQIKTDEAIDGWSDVGTFPSSPRVPVNSKIIDGDGSPVGIATEDKQDDIIEAIRSTKDLEGIGDLTVGTEEVEIEITGTPTHQIRIRADVSNTGIIFLGKSEVLADGSNDFVRLESGDEIVMPYDDVDSALYAISDEENQKINIGVLI